MDIYTVYGLLTLLLLLIFLGIVIWVFGIKRKRDFDAAADLPLQENRDHGNRREDKDHE